MRQVIISLLARQPGRVPAIMYVAASVRLMFGSEDDLFSGNWMSLVNAALSHLPVVRHYRIPYISVPELFAPFGQPGQHYGAHRIGSL